MFRKRLKILIGNQDIRPLAKKCEISEGAFRSWLREGGSEPKLSNLVKMADHFKVSVGWLAAGEEPKHPGEEKKTSAPASSKIAATFNHWKTIERKEEEQQQEQIDVNLQHIIDWLQEETAKDKRNSLYYFTDFFLKYPEFQDYMRKKMPEARFPLDNISKQKDRTA